MVCAFCGQPAIAKAKMTIARREGGAEAGLVALLIGGLLPALVATWASTERHAVGLPACDEHRGWRVHQNLRVAGLVLLPIVAVLIIVAWPNMAVAVLGLSAASWLALFVVHRWLAIPIRATNIHAHGCVLWGVAPELAAAFQEMYRSETAEVDRFLDNL
jgi:hypothetical protein